VFKAWPQHPDFTCCSAASWRVSQNRMPEVATHAALADTSPEYSTRVPVQGLLIQASPWDASPSKKRRVSVDDLEQCLQKLSLSDKTVENVQLDSLFKKMTMSAPSPCRRAASFSGSGPSAPREASSNEFKDRLQDPAMEVCGAAADSTAKSGGVQCRAIVPFVPPCQRRWRRIPPTITIVPRSAPSSPPIAKFAVDSEGTAFVLPETLRTELSRARDQGKRSLNEEHNYASTAIVIYQKPRKHDLVEDFMSLKL